MNTESDTVHHRQDRRVSRTRRQLRSALMTLIIEKGYDAVTIEDITERADLGRTTFYLHYKDKEELLLESIENTARELYEQVVAAAPPAAERSREAGLHAIDIVFQHAGANSIFYQIILQGGAARKVRSYILAFLSEAVRPYFESEQALPASVQVPLAVLSSYFATSLLGFMTWWLETKAPYSPEQASKFFTFMFFNGIPGLREA